MPQLWAVADAYRQSSFGTSRQAFFVLLELGVPPAALITYVEDRVEEASAFQYASDDGQHLRLTLNSAIEMASTRPDSSFFPRIEALGRKYWFLRNSSEAYERALWMEARWATMTPEEAAYQMAFQADLFSVPRQDETLSHPYFGPSGRAASKGGLRLQAAESLAALATHEPEAVYSGIDRWAGERVARLTPWQRERYPTYEGIPLREAIRLALLDVVGLPDQGQ